MKDSEFNQWLELGERRPRTAEAIARWERYLAAHPEARVRWEEEQALETLLHLLPQVPVSTNFAARVRQAVERLDAPRAPARWKSRGWVWLWRRGRGWAWAAGLAGLLWLAVFEYQIHTRTKLAQSMIIVSGVGLPPNEVVLQDFDAINRMAQAPPVVDKDLLAALQAPE